MSKRRAHLSLDVDDVRTIQHGLERLRREVVQGDSFAAAVIVARCDHLLVALGRERARLEDRVDPRRTEAS